MRKLVSSSFEVHMRNRLVRPYLISAAVLMTAGGPLIAQGPPAIVERPELPAGSSRCLMGSTALRAATGGILGGWIGFVAAKIKVSDWNDESHSASGTRMRNQMTIGGALIGAIGASLVHVNKNCTAATTTGAQPVRTGRQPITAEEISRAGVSGNVYDVVYTLRRNWLNTRGLNSGTESVHLVVSGDSTAAADGEPQLVVYLDNVRLGAIEEMKRLSAVGVTSIRYYDPAQANYLWGTGHTHGAIQVMMVQR
jgi:hypothetical protein